MQKSKSMSLSKMSLYLKFIDLCKNKKYDSNLVLHKHHILPKCIYGNTKEIIKLSVDDHIIAHLMLAECFDHNSEENIHNLRSARILSNKSIKDIEIIKKISDSYKGENNPFWKKSHSESVINLLKTISGNRTRNKTYFDLYGNNSELEKKKRSEGVKKAHQNRSSEEKLRISKKMSENAIPKFGSLNPMSKKVEVDGIVYDSMASARRALNISKYKLIKIDTFKYL